MGKLVAVIGSTGVGKTTLVRALCKEGSFVTGLEEHDSRPFQGLFKSNPHYALANQVDYLLVRARQEQALRSSPYTGLLDGGLELDFHCFTRLFHARGWLDQAEFDLCKNFYQFIRSLLPPPELFIRMKAGQEVISRRLSQRQRLNLTSVGDITRLDCFLDEWLTSVESDCIITIDATEEDLEYRNIIPGLYNLIRDKLVI